MGVKSIIGLVWLTALVLFSCNLSGPEDEVGDTAISSSQFLGRGYDVFSAYADPLDVRGEVLDFDEMNNAGLIERLQLERSNFETIEGHDVETYMNKLSQKVEVSASYAGFSGSVKVNFDESHYTNSSYSFATVTSLIQKYSARIEAGIPVATLKSYLTDNADAMLNNGDVEPLTVFMAFGTHVMRGIIIGGRLDYSVSADMTEVGGDTSIGVFAEVGYEGAFDVNVSSETVSATEWSDFTSSSKKTLKVYGGASEYGQYIINEDKQSYVPWIESIGDNPVFCEFDSTNPLIPIWELCDDSDRSSELQNYFNSTYAVNNAILTSDAPHLCILEIGLYDFYSSYEVYYGNHSPINPIYGRYGITQDLNEDAGGDFIYIWYKYGYDNDPALDPIDGIYIVNTTDGDSWTQPGYLKPEVLPNNFASPGLDLNRGAGGDHIYLFYSRNGGTPIRSIAITNTDGKRYYSLPTQIVTVNPGLSYVQDATHNLNAGNGGDGIYLWRSTDLVD